MAIDQFDAPVPGQSLTDAPKAASWERPPQFTNLSDACDFVWNTLTRAPNAKVLIALLDKGIPVEALTRVIVFAGFSSGKWTVDLALLMVPAVMSMIAGIAYKLGLHHVRIKMDRNTDIQTLAKLNSIDFSSMSQGPNTPAPNMQSQEPTPMVPGADMSSGLMSPLSGLVKSQIDPNQLSNPMLAPAANPPLGSGV